MRRLRELGGPDYRDTTLALARSADLTLARSAALGMWGIDYEPANPADFAILDEFAKNPDWHIKELVIWALSSIGKSTESRQAAIERILAVHAGNNKKLADRICDAFLYNRIPLTSLSEHQFKRLLDNLIEVPDLDEHGIGLVLNWSVDNMPRALIDFLKKRVVRAVDARSSLDWSYDILPRHGNQVHLHGLRDKVEAKALRDYLLPQVESNESIRDELINLFWVITALDEAFGLLRPWVHSADPSQFRLALQFLRDAPYDLAFSEPSVSTEVLEAAQNFGPSQVESAIAAVVANGHPKLFQIVGDGLSQPHANLKSSAEAALSQAGLNPLMRRLYEAIAASATISVNPFAEFEEEEF